MTDFQQENQKLSPDPIVELFEFDATSLGGGLYRFYSGAPTDATLLWKGVPYVPLPIEASGWEFSGKGSLPTPSLRISNIHLLMSSIIQNTGDPLGATITRWVTYEKFLDSPVGSDPDGEAFRKEIYQIERRVSQDEAMVEFELSAAIDQDGRKLPSRQVVRSFCNHRYRTPVENTPDTFDYSNATCPYAGSDTDRDGGDADQSAPEDPYFTQSGLPTTDWSADVCGKKLSDCRLRFVPLAQPLPFRGFPAVDRIRRES